MQKWLKSGMCLLVVAMMVFQQNTAAFPQGISRTNGIGFRFDFWKTARSSSLFRVTENSVEVSGAGFWFYFFSRFADEWFYEFQLGAVGSVISQDVVGGQADDVTAIIPLLMGVRYDFLANRNHGNVQPYLSLGFGPYWITNVDSPTNGTLEQVESGVKPGAYTGTGLNIALTSWFALNFDIKYHFVDLKVGQDFSGFDFGMGVSFMWGSKRELIRVKEVKMLVHDIYPAYYDFYNFYPVALVTLQNMTKGKVEVNIRSNISHFSQRPKYSGYIEIAGKETRDIPIHVILGPQIRTVRERESAVLDLQIEARAGRHVTKEFSSPLIVHNRNSWNGEMDKLVFFVTPEDQAVLEVSRRVAKTMNQKTDPGRKNFSLAQALFEAMNRLGLHYQSDPNVPFYKDDRVQYPQETLNLKSGDCDDLVVLYASLLESLGLSTSFVEVRDPEKEIAHLYLMFDSEVPVQQAHLISSNEKRYLIRERNSGHKTVWIPVETTLLGQPFDDAWKAGALEYLQDGVLKNGLAEGWVRIIDVE